MATQAALFAETFAAMKKAVKRKAYDSEEEDPIEQLTNRGNKLRKHARHVREGQVALPNGPEVYRKTIEHAGYQREIISQRPRLLDENGFELDSDDEDDEERNAAHAEATENYPYENIRIEQIMAPLTSAADLPNHPTLSRPFESKTLTGLVHQACETVQKEKRSLWKMKRLLRRLCGDDPWVPCEVFETGNDLALFGDVPEGARNGQLSTLQSKNHQDLAGEIAVRSDQEASSKKSDLISQVQTNRSDVGHRDVVMKDAGAIVGEAQPVEPIEANGHDKDANLDLSTDAVPSASKPDDAEGQHSKLGHEDTEMAMDVGPINSDHASIENDAGSGGLGVAEDQAEEEIEPAVPRRMRTRAQANAVSDDVPASQTRSSTPESQSDFYIHPYFLAPPNSHPARDFGLPMDEAADARRLLQLYIQKQEEVCRGAQKLYEGLLRADRMRKDVMKWAKAEAHIGELSDGEDWYDREEWDLEDDLIKGHDDEEEETTTTNKKTTRARRV